MRTFHYDAALWLDQIFVILIFGNLFKNLFIRNQLFMLLLIFFVKLVYDLSFLESSESYGSHDGIPVPETVFLQKFFHVFRFGNIA